MEEERAVRDLQEELSKLTTLKKHSGFVYLIEIARAQIESRQQAVILNPLKSMDETLEQEYKKGEVAGIMLFTEFADIQIKALQDEIESLLTEQGEGESDENSNS